MFGNCGATRLVFWLRASAKCSEQSAAATRGAGATRRRSLLELFALQFTMGSSNLDTANMIASMPVGEYGSVEPFLIRRTTTNDGHHSIPQYAQQAPGDRPLSHGAAGLSLTLPARHPSLRRLPVELPNAQRTVAIVTLRNRTLSPLAELFIDDLRAIVKPLAKKK